MNAQWRARLAATGTCIGLLVSAGTASAAPVTLIFEGQIFEGTYNRPGCPGLCPGAGFTVPPAGNPISFSVRYDTSSSGTPESLSPPADSVTRYDLTSPALVDFGYGSDFAFSSYSIRIVDNQNSSAPDRMYIFRDPPAPPNMIGYWFSIELGASASSFLIGPGLPDSLDFSLVDLQRSAIFYSPNSVSSEYSGFVITSIRTAEVASPPVLALIFAGIVAGGLRRSRRPND